MWQRLLRERPPRGREQPFPQPHGKAANHDPFGIQQVDENRQGMAELFA
jgi:hypothetical protein